VTGASILRRLAGALAGAVLLGSVTAPQATAGTVVQGWQPAYAQTTVIEPPQSGPAGGVVVRGERGPGGLQQFVTSPKRPFDLVLTGSSSRPVQVLLEWSRAGEVYRRTARRVKLEGSRPVSVPVSPPPRGGPTRVLVSVEPGQTATLRQIDIAGVDPPVIVNPKLETTCEASEIPGWQNRYANTPLGVAARPGGPIVVKATTGPAGLDQSIQSPPLRFTVIVRGTVDARSKAMLTAEWSSGGKIVKRSVVPLRLQGGQQVAAFKPPRADAGLQIQVVETQPGAVLQVDSVKLDLRGQELLKNPELTVPSCASVVQRSASPSNPQHDGGNRRTIIVVGLGALAALAAAAVLIVARRRRRS
jgi:hypothetical protein